MKCLNKIAMNKIVFLFCSIVMLLFIDVIPCYAASADIKISSKDVEVEKGKTIKVEIKVTSSDSIGDFEGFLTYNPDVLEFESESSFIAGGDGLIKITDTNVATGVKSKKYVIKFKAIAIGESSIEFREQPSVYNFDDSSNMSVSSNQIKISVKAEKEASANADLKELKVAPGKITPDFDKSITEYKMEVSADVDQLIISSLPADEKSNVEIEGNNDLKAGDNMIEIKVKAESGATKTYKIIVIKEANEEVKVDNEGQANDELSNNPESDDEYNSIENNSNTFAKIKEIDGNLYLQSSYQYELLTPDDYVVIPKGYEKTTITINGIKVKAYKSKEVDEIVLLYAKGPSGMERFYQYDTIENTMQRFLEPVSTQTNDTVTYDMKDKESPQIIILSIIVLILLATIIILIISLVQSHKINKRKENTQEKIDLEV